MTTTASTAPARRVRAAAARGEGTGPARPAEIRATVFHVNRADRDPANPDADTSQQIAFTDQFIALAGSLGATIMLPTPYNVDRLFQILEQSNILPQCIDAYVTNTVGTGWETGPTARGLKTSEGEVAELESFIEHANSQESLSTVMQHVIRDRESVGFGFKEIIRDVSGNISLLRWAPAKYTRLCAQHPDKVLVEYTIHRGRRVSNVKEWRHFRRFVQIVNGHQVWFKEFGDPRAMDYRNGAFQGESGFSAAYPATELRHYKNPSNEWYGVPKWISQLPNIIGSRESEEVNMRYFQDNTVPPMLLMVGGGRLTSASHRELTRALNEDSVGAARQNKIMLLEAVGESDSLDGKGAAIDLKVEKLTDARQSDGLFDKYDAANQGKVRSSFRLPPITVGHSQDVNFATAATSAFVAESQVFGPARNGIDEDLNKNLINGQSGLALKSVKLISRTPAITTPELIVKTLTALNVMGAVTPRAAQSVANKMLQLELPAYPEKGQEGYEAWMDQPVPVSNIIAAREKAAIDQNNPQAASHAGQASKDAATKDVEDSGDVAAKAPEHGQE